jgi:hypothetical protein
MRPFTCIFSLYYFSYLKIIIMTSNTNSSYQCYSMYADSVAPVDIQYDYLSPTTQKYFQHSIITICYMSVCFSCTIWQMMAAGELVYRARRWLHFAVFFQTILSFCTILASLLNPVSDITCEFVCS